MLTQLRYLGQGAELLGFTAPAMSDWSFGKRPATILTRTRPEVKGATRPQFPRRLPTLGRAASGLSGRPQDPPSAPLRAAPAPPAHTCPPDRNTAPPMPSESRAASIKPADSPASGCARHAPTRPQPASPARPPSQSRDPSCPAATECPCSSPPRTTTAG